jgi:hypothetical protein
MQHPSAKVATQKRAAAEFFKYALNLQQHPPSFGMTK